MLQVLPSNIRVSLYFFKKSFVLFQQCRKTSSCFSDIVLLCIVAASQPSWAAERNLLAGLARLRVNPAVNRGFDIVAAHSFSQWQACLKGALYLNQLLLMPLPEPHLSW